MTARRLVTAALVAALPLLAACGSEDDGGAIVAPEGDASTSTTAAPGSTTAPTTPTTAAPSTQSTEPEPPDAPDPRPAVQVVEVEVVGGEPVGGPVAAEVELGAMVSIQVTADVADEVHVHGYDLFADVTPGVLGEITFTADLPGQFEVELEDAGVLLVELTVS